MGQGRRKVPIVKVDDQRKRHVTFSKRHRGLFIKACHLCSVGFRAAIVVFTPSGKAYSFSHPNAEAVATDFLNNNNVGDKEEEKKQGKKKKKSELVCKEGEEEEENAVEVAEVWGSGEVLKNAGVESMGFEELRKMERSMMEVRGKIVEELGRILVDKPLTLCSWDWDDLNE